MPASVLFIESESGYSEEVSKEELKDVASHFIKTLCAIKKINKKVSINCEVYIGDCLVAPYVPLSQIYKENGDKEAWDFIKDLATRSPLSSGFEKQLYNLDSYSACVGGVKQSNASACASLLNTGIVSLHTEPLWHDHQLDAVIQNLDSLGNLQSYSSIVNNFSEVEHANQHNVWINNLGVTQHPNSQKFWMEKEDRFPNLRFIKRVLGDIKVLANSGAPYAQALECLDSLNSDISKWDKNGYPDISYKHAKGEHDKREKLSIFRDEIIGEDVSFEAHAYFTGGLEGRIHFRLDVENGKMVIGYIGLKLGI